MGDHRRNPTLIFVFLAITCLLGRVWGSQASLNIIQITPTYTGANQYLSGSTTITVIFDLPVIALGQEWNSSLPDPFFLTDQQGRQNFIPGQFEWVTSSIVRFDPRDSWPTDLKLTLTINQNLQTYDGISLSTTAKKQTRKYQTPSLSFQISTVTSDKASNLTDGNWNAWTRARLPSGKWMGYMPEVPADGKIQLTFNTDVNLTEVVKNLIIQSKQTNDQLQVNAEACDRNCLWVTPQDQLAVDTEYWLLLPAGSTYSNLSGSTATQTRASISGLHSFIFPYEDNTRASYLSWDLYLRHGLSQNITNNTDIWEKNIQISPKVNFSVSIPTKSHLRIQSYEFQPNTNYTVTITGNSSITDGFGLKLQNQTFKVQTRPFTFYVQGAENVDQYPQIIYFDSTKWKVPGVDTNDQKIPTNGQTSGGVPSNGTTHKEDEILLSFLSQGTTTCAKNDNLLSNIYLTKVTSDNLVSTLNQFFALPQSDDAPDDYDLVLEIAPSEKAQITSADIEPLLDVTENVTERTGLIFVEQLNYTPNMNSCYSYPQFTYINFAPFGANVVSLGNYQVLVSVLTLNNSQPIQNANVKILSFAQNEYSGSVSDKTGSDGSVILTLPPKSRTDFLTVFCLIEYNNILHFTSVPSVFGSTIPQYESSVITDRGFYDINDQIFIKGYIRSYDNDLNLVVPQLNGKKTQVLLKVVWSDQEVSYYFDFSSDFGTFFGNLTVPPNARFGTQYLSFYLPQSKGQPSLFQTISVLIAEPKIPTAVLTFVTPALVIDPSSPTINVSVSAMTYTGIGIVGAQIEVYWTLQRNNYDDNDDQNSGLQRFNSMIAGSDPSKTLDTNQYPDEIGKIELVITDPSGVLNTQITFPFDNPASDGDLLVLNVDYISPTNDLLTQSLTLPFLSTNMELVLQTSTDSGDILPGFEFGVFVDTKLVPTGVSVENISVTLELRSWDGKTEIDYDPSKHTITNLNSFASLPQQQLCRTISNNGTIPLCKFNLPSYDNYILLGSMNDTNKNAVYTAVPIYASTSKFDAVPLRSFPKINVKANKQDYSIGDTVYLSFFDPYRLQSPSALTASDNDNDNDGDNLLTGHKNNTNNNKTSTSNVLVVYGNGYAAKSFVYTLNNTATSQTSNSSYLDYETISFTLGDECKYLCNVILIFNWGADTFPHDQAPDTFYINVPIPDIHDSAHPYDDGDNTGSRSVVPGDGDGTITIEPGHNSSSDGSGLGNHEFPKIRVSPLFSWDQQHSQITRLSFKIKENPDKKLNISLSLPQYTFSPGDSTSIDIKLNLISNGDNDNSKTVSATSGEVSVFVVDQSYLDLVPHPITDLYTDMTSISSSSGLTTDFSYVSTLVNYLNTPDQFISQNVYNNSLLLYYARLRENGWISPSSWILYPLGSLEDIELTDQQFLDKYFTPITEFPPILFRGLGGGGPMVFAVGASENSIDKSGGGDSSVQNNLIRSNFVAVPLFTGRQLVDASGSTSIKLTLPDNLSTFAVYAYATSGPEYFASTMTTIVTKKKVNMSPVAPNFVRIGDTFQIGVSLIASATDFDGQLKVIVETSCQQQSNQNNALVGLFTLLSSNNTQTIDLNDDNNDKSGDNDEKTNNIQVLFTFNATTMGSGYFRFTLQQSGATNPLDVLQIPLTVEGQQDSVYLATSLTITAGDNNNDSSNKHNSDNNNQNNDQGTNNNDQQLFVVNQGVKIPQDAQGSGKLDIAVSMGKQAFILQNSYYLLQLGNTTYNPALSSSLNDTGDGNDGGNDKKSNNKNGGGNKSNKPTPTSLELLSSMTPTAYFSTIVASAGVGSPLTSSKSFQLLSGSSRVVFSSSLSSLSSYTDPRYGLSYYPVDDSSSSSSPPSSVDMNLNLYALYISSRSPYFPAIKSFDEYSQWKDAVSLGWTQSLRPYYSKSSSSSSSSSITLSSPLYDQLAFTYLSLGLDWTPPSSPRGSSPDPTLSLTSLKKHYNSMSTSGKLALGLAYLLENMTDPILKNITSDVENLIRIQGRTAYVSDGDTGHVDSTATSLALEFLVLSPFTTTTHPKSKGHSSGQGYSTASILPFIASYLANENTASQLNYFAYYYSSTDLQTLVYSLFSLTTNEQQTAGFDPNLEIEVDSGSTALFTAMFSSEMNAPPLQATSVNFTDLAKTSKGTYQQLQVYAGPATDEKPIAGQVTMTFGMQFVPQLPVSANKTFSHGITVQKILQPYNAANRTVVSGSIFDQKQQNGVDLKIGDFVVVTIQITATDDLTNVRLVDLLPAALQPLDTNIYAGITTPSQSPSTKQSGPILVPPSQFPQQDTCDWCYYTYSAFDYREFRDDQVIGFARSLAKGSYVFSYVAYVSSGGQFYVPSAHVYAMAQPEIMGLSQNYLIKTGSPLSNLNNNNNKNSFDSSICY